MRSADRRPATLSSVSAFHLDFQNPAVATLILGLFLLSYTLLVVIYLVPRNAVEDLDFWYQIDRGLSANWANLNSFVDGFYPIGYPLLLASAIRCGIDVLRFAQFLSWFGGLLALIAVFRMAFHTIGLAGASLTMVLLLTNITFVYWSAWEGTDMLSAGLQVTALSLVWDIAPKQPLGRTLLRASAIGALIGLGYLVRYTALLLLPCVLLAVALMYRHTIKNGVLVLAMVGIAFFAAACVQVVPSLLVHHQLFYNAQPKNVWFGIYGNGDYVNMWNSVPNTITLREVIALDTGKFLVHWWEQLSAYLLSPMQWTPTLQVAWVVGAITLLFIHRISFIPRLLLLAFMTLTLVATAMAWLFPRFLITVLVCQALIIAMLVDQVCRFARNRRIRYALFGVAVLGLLYSSGASLVLAWLNTPTRTKPIVVHTFLRHAGLQDPKEVATNDPYLHATDIPARTRYSQLYFFVSKPEDLDDILKRRAAREWKYLVIDYESPFGDYRAIDPDSPAVAARLTILQRTETQVIYCIKPCAAPAPAHP